MEENGKVGVDDDQHRLIVMDDLSMPSKRSTVSHIVQTVKNGLCEVDAFLLELASADVAHDKREMICQDVGKRLQDLERVFGDAAEYLPAYEQRLLQSRLSSASRILHEKRKIQAADRGFSFRKTVPKAKPNSESRGEFATLLLKNQNVAVSNS